MRIPKRRNIEMSCYLAVDIGASSGRHILGTVENGKLRLEEIYRFENNIVKKDGSVFWDIEHLLSEVIAGIRHAGELGKIPDTLAIDTWGVDYVLLDDSEKEIMPVVAYRDPRTLSVIDDVEKIIGAREMYERTGIQKQAFNTVYQLYCDKLSGKLDKARHFLMIPEYLAYKLTGIMKNEYTNASTTNLVNAESREWDYELIDKLGLPKNIFKPLTPPASKIGSFSKHIQDEVGFNTNVVLCATHDTASAVAACPLADDSMYISSGTWSLVGKEIFEPITTDAAYNANFTNEGGIEYRFRFLQNIMGMWLFQNIRRETNKMYSYDEMMHMAMNSEFKEIVDVNSPEFTAPDSMIEAIKTKLGKPNLPLSDVIACVYNSLAAMYKNAADRLEEITGEKISSIQIVGGGGSDKYLNALTSKVSGRRVFTGLKEATATGNIMAQHMCAHRGVTLADCREIIKNSFEIIQTDTDKFFNN